MRARTEKISDEVESDRQPTLPLLWFMAKNAEETETGNQAERIKGMVDHFETFKKSSLQLKTTNFSNPPRWGASAISKNSPRDSQKFAQPQNRVCISQKRSRKDSN